MLLTCSLCLQEYTGLRTLYLEQNAIADIENLDNLINLRCLYLGRNMICSTLGLQMLTNLETLDLAENVISTVTDLSKLPLLKTLNISGNRLHTMDDIRDLSACAQLQSLDMASNRLEAPEVADFVMTMPLLYLRLMGNPVVSKYKYVPDGVTDDVSIRCTTRITPFQPAPPVRIFHPSLLSPHISPATLPA